MAKVIELRPKTNSRPKASFLDLVESANLSLYNLKTFALTAAIRGENTAASEMAYEFCEQAYRGLAQIKAKHLNY